MHTCAQYGRDRERLCQKRNIPAKLDEHLSKALNLGEATEHDDGVLISRGLLVEATQDKLQTFRAKPVGDRVVVQLVPRVESEQAIWLRGDLNIRIVGVIITINESGFHWLSYIPLAK